MSDDNMTMKEIRQWYATAGVDFNEEDFGPRSDVGESIGRQHAPAERGHERVLHSDSPLENTEYTDGIFARMAPLWGQRENREEVLALEDFFSPYLAMLPRAKGNTLREWMFGHKTYQQLADEACIRRQSAHERVTSALAQLIVIIEEDSDQLLAEEVLNEYWKARFGYPLV